MDNKLVKNMTERAQRKPQRVVFVESDNYKVLKAAQVVIDENIAIPILLGNEKRIRAVIEENNLELDGVQIIDPKDEEFKPKRYEYIAVEPETILGAQIHRCPCERCRP